MPRLCHTNIVNKCGKKMFLHCLSIALKNVLLLTLMRKSGKNAVMEKKYFNLFKNKIPAINVQSKTVQQKSKLA